MLSDAASSSAAIAKWQSALARREAEIGEKYAGGNPTVAELLLDIEHWRRTAISMADIAKGMNGITPSALQDGQRNVQALENFKAQLQLQRKDLTVTNVLLDEAIWLMQAPIKWLVRIGSPVLRTQVTYKEMAEAAVNAPSSALKWTLDQLLKTLGLPTWILPVAAGTVVVGLGAWAYFTFLAPVSRVSRRINPRRSRRRRHA